MNFLNVFNIAKATILLETGLDYAELDNDHVMVVAYDKTVWVCKDSGLSCSLDELKMVQRIL